MNLRDRMRTDLYPPDDAYGPLWCEWGTGGDPANGCDNPAVTGGLCAEHAHAYAVLTATPEEASPERDKRLPAWLIHLAMTGLMPEPEIEEES